MSDRFTGMVPEELRAERKLVDVELRELHADPDGNPRKLTPAEQTRFDRLLAEREVIDARLAEHQRIAVAMGNPRSIERVYGTLTRSAAPFDGDLYRSSPEVLRDAALGVLDRRGGRLKPEQGDQVDRLLRQEADDERPELASRILLTESDQYRAAWKRIMSDPHPVLSAEEAESLREFRRWEQRTMGEWGAGSLGGYGVPTFIDPSIIATAQGSGNPFLTIARQVPVNTNHWKGVSSAGVTWSFDTEGATVSDDSPVLAQPEVLVHMARGFIPFSIEVGEDYVGFEAEMARLLADGYDELLLDKFTRGSGTGEPQGIVTALSANGAVRVKLTTAGSLGAPDPYAVWKALPQRYRTRASWLMSVDVNNAIRQLGTADALHALTVQLTDASVDFLFRKPVYESSYMEDTTTWSTSVAGLAVVGDFSNYLVARRSGINTELVPMLFDVTYNRPTGQRGWFAYARIGGGSVNDAAFRLLVNS